jgi:hypothetical protein
VGQQQQGQLGEPLLELGQGQAQLLRHSDEEELPLRALIPLQVPLVAQEPHLPGLRTHSCCCGG